MVPRVKRLHISISLNVVNCLTCGHAHADAIRLRLPFRSPHSSREIIAFFVFPLLRFGLCHESPTDNSGKASLAAEKSQDARRRVIAAITKMQRDGAAINFNTVCAVARVSKLIDVFGIELRPNRICDIRISYRNTVHQPRDLMATSNVELVVRYI